MFTGSSVQREFADGEARGHLLVLGEDSASVAKPVGDLPATPNGGSPVAKREARLPTLGDDSAGVAKVSGNRPPPEHDGSAVAKEPGHLPVIEDESSPVMRPVATIAGTRGKA